jgi:hypothetical protein
MTASDEIRKMVEKHGIHQDYVNSPQSPVPSASVGYARGCLFDQTTERKAEEYCPREYGALPKDILKQAVDDFSGGRNSAKESLVELARAVENMTHYRVNSYEYQALAKEAIAAVKARGDWPLSEEIP